LLRVNIQNEWPKNPLATEKYTWPLVAKFVVTLIKKDLVSFSKVNPNHLVLNI